MSQRLRTLNQTARGRSPVVVQYTVVCTDVGLEGIVF